MAQFGDGGEAGDGWVDGVADETFDVDVVGGGETDANDALVEEHVGGCVEHVGMTSDVAFEGVGERSAVNDGVSWCVVGDGEPGVVKLATGRQLVPEPDKSEDKQQDTDGGGAELPCQLVVVQGCVELFVEERLVAVDV